MVGLALFGGGDLTLLSGTQVGFADAALRVLLATLVPGAVLRLAGGGRAVRLHPHRAADRRHDRGRHHQLLSFILDAIPQLSWLHPWLLTHWWLAFGELLRDPIAWGALGRGLLTAAAYALVFWLAAWARFAGKDVTS